MKRLIFIIAAVTIAGCSPDPDMPLQQRQLKMDTAAKPADNDRIEVTRIGIFRDPLAYGDRRGVYIIRDKQTGSEYIGISGVGISEVGRHSAGKTSTGDER